jgi:hypothetical protein
MQFMFSLNNMKHSFALLLAMLVSCWIYGEENFDPFTPPKTDADAPPQAAIDPFAEPGDADEDSQNGSAHRWDDQVVDSGNRKAPEYMTIGGWSYAGKDQIGILYRVGLKHYNDAIGHPDLNRGVVLLHGRPEEPDLCTWLRPFRITRDHAEFVVMGSPKQLGSMHLAFIPREGNRRYLHSLQRATQEIVEKKNVIHSTKDQQADTGQPSFSSESKSEGGNKPEPEAEGSSR